MLVIAIPNVKQPFPNFLKIKVFYYKLNSLVKIDIAHMKVKNRLL